MTAGAGIQLAEVSLRVETAHDYAAVERLTREAFWNVYKPGCDEHYLLHILRDSPGYLPDLHLLALWRGEIIGNIVYSRAYVVDEAQHRYPVLCFGPLGVLPAHQRQGIGSLLVSHSLEKARSLGERAVLIFGHPGYYHRFGFGPAASYGIATKGGQQFDQFMALPLFAGALAGIHGRFHEDAAFEALDPARVARYDQRYPPREKLVLPGQLGS